MHSEVPAFLCVRCTVIGELLPIIGAAISALFGFLVLLAALMWLFRCQNDLQDAHEQMERTNERLHKAGANLTYVESVNYEYADQRREDRNEINKLKAENAALSREIDELKAQLAGRQPTRRSDDRAKTS